MRHLPFLLAFAALSSPAQDSAVFHAHVSLVHVDAEVVAQDGRILTGLSRNDFRILDEGKPQTIVDFSAEEQPLDLILLFDISGSMRPNVQAVAEAARQGLAELRPGDRVSVMVFNTRSRVVAPFTEDLDAVERTVREDVMTLEFGGGTLIQKAVDDAARRFFDEPRTQRRRAVLIVTDNIGMRTRRDESVVRDFWEADALLSGLIVRDKAFAAVHTIGTVLAPQTLLLQAGMKGIAEQTGGDAIRSDEPGPAFVDMMHRIRSRYSLYYPAPAGKPGQLRTIHVELTADAQKRFPKARVRARHGYRVS
jgi:Ca-activated chloride channel family protein